MNLQSNTICGTHMECVSETHVNVEYLEYDVSNMKGFGVFLTVPYNVMNIHEMQSTARPYTIYACTYAYILRYNIRQDQLDMYIYIYMSIIYIRDLCHLHVRLRLEHPPILINENWRLWDQWIVKARTLNVTAVLLSSVINRVKSSEAMFHSGPSKRANCGNRVGRACFFAFFVEV